MKTAKINDTLKTVAKTSKKSARELVIEAIGSADAPTVAALPTIRNLRKTANRYITGDNLPNPASVMEIILNEGNTKTSRNEDFLLYDSARDGIPEDEEEAKRLIIFGTRNNLDILKICQTIAMDGTFSIAPPLFRQLFTIHGNFSTY